MLGCSFRHQRFVLNDLSAGSERVKETKSVGGTFAESQNINKSLLTLGKFALHFIVAACLE